MRRIRGEITEGELASAAFSELARQAERRQRLEGDKAVRSLAGANAGAEDAELVLASRSCDPPGTDLDYDGPGLARNVTEVEAEWVAGGRIIAVQVGDVRLHAELGQAQPFRVREYDARAVRERQRHDGPLPPPLGASNEAGGAVRSRLVRPERARVALMGRPGKARDGPCRDGPAVDGRPPRNDLPRAGSQVEERGASAVICENEGAEDGSLRIALGEAERKVWRRAPSVRFGVVDTRTELVVPREHPAVGPDDRRCLRRERVWGEHPPRVGRRRVGDPAGVLLRRQVVPVELSAVDDHLPAGPDRARQVEPERRGRERAPAVRSGVVCRASSRFPRPRDVPPDEHLAPRPDGSHRGLRTERRLRKSPPLVGRRTVGGAVLARGVGPAAPHEHLLPRPDGRRRRASCNGSRRDGAPATRDWVVGSPVGVRRASVIHFAAPEEELTTRPDRDGFGSPERRRLELRPARVERGPVDGLPGFGLGWCGVAPAAHDEDDQKREDESAHRPGYVRGGERGPGCERWG